MTTTATIYKINLNTAYVQDICLQFEFRNIIFIKWSEDYLYLCVEDF